MSAQLALALPAPPSSSETVVINSRCRLAQEGDQRVVVVAGLPVHHYSGDDLVAAAYAMVFLVDSGFAQQNEVARAFGVSTRSVRRHQQRYAEGGAGDAVRLAAGPEANRGQALAVDPTAES